MPSSTRNMACCPWMSSLVLGASLICRLLENPRTWLNLLHLHGEDLMFDQALITRSRSSTGTTGKHLRPWLEAQTSFQG